MYQKFFVVSLTSILPSGKGIIGKYALSHFDSNLGPMIDCHDPGRTASGEQIYTMVLSIMLNRFSAMSQYILLYSKK